LPFRSQTSRSSAPAPLLPPQPTATGRLAPSAGRRRDRPRRTAPPRLGPAQAPNDLAGPPQRISEGVPKHFASRHARLEHKGNIRASRYILYTRARRGPIDYAAVFAAASRSFSWASLFHSCARQRRNLRSRSSLVRAAYHSHWRACSKHSAMVGDMARSPACLPEVVREH
jgi:hypothetical protein